MIDDGLVICFEVVDKLLQLLGMVADAGLDEQCDLVFGIVEKGDVFEKFHKEWSRLEDVDADHNIWIVCGLDVVQVERCLAAGQASGGRVPRLGQIVAQRVERHLAVAIAVDYDRLGGRHLVVEVGVGVGFIDHGRLDETNLHLVEGAVKILEQKRGQVELDANTVA